MASQTDAKSDGLGIWIRFWDLLIAFVLLVSAFLMVRLDAVPQLRALADNNAYFGGKPLLLDTYRRGYSFEMVRDHLHALGGPGRDYYAHTFMPMHDLALSLFLLTFMVLLILYATQNDKSHAIALPSWVRKVLLVPPLIQFLLDIGENYLLRMTIESYPWISAKVVQQASELTQAKWMAIFVNALIVLGLGSFTVYRWLARPRTT